MYEAGVGTLIKCPFDFIGNVIIVEVIDVEVFRPAPYDHDVRKEASIVQNVNQVPKYAFAPCVHLSLSAFFMNRSSDFRCLRTFSKERLCSTLLLRSSSTASAVPT